MEASRMPDRLNYSTKAKELIEKLDEENYMGLGKITRSELFLFAMSLGAESHTKTEVKNPYTGGLVLDKSVDARTQASMYAQFISKLEDPENELDKIDQKGHVYKMAEQYANTGFEYIADYLETKKADELIMDLILELDEQFEAIKKNEQFETTKKLDEQFEGMNEPDLYFRRNSSDYPKVAEE